MPPSTANLLAQPGKRDPRTLGDDSVPTPTGGSEAEELLGGRISNRMEDAEVSATALRGTLEELATSFNQISGFEYDPKMLGGNIPGKPMLRLKRALNQNFDEQMKQRFEVKKAEFLGARASEMAAVAAQLRQLDPSADAAIQKIQEEAIDAAIQRKRLFEAPQKAMETMQVIRDFIPADQIAPGLEARLFALYANTPDSNEMVKAELDRRKSVRILAPGLTEEDIKDPFYARDEPMIRKIQKEEAEKNAKIKGDKDLIANYMQFSKLRQIRDDQITNHERILLRPAPVPTDPLGFSSRMMTLEIPELINEAKLRAARSFLNIVTDAVGEKHARTAMNRVYDPEEVDAVMAALEDFVPMTAEEVERIRRAHVEQIRRDLNQFLPQDLGQ
jgi:hypothetical protein